MIPYLGDLAAKPVKAARLVKKGMSAAEATKDAMKAADATQDATKASRVSSSGNKFVVDPKGNTLVVKPGETVTSSPDGKWIQVRDADGKPTGQRLDGGHKPASHPDPRAQEPHAHVPGITNPDGTPWLPVNK